MTYRTVTVNLERGLESGGVNHKDIIIREMIVADMKNIPTNLSAEERAIMIISKRVISMGNIEFPTPDMFDKLTFNDFQKILDATSKFDGDTPPSAGGDTSDPKMQNPSTS